MRIGIFGGTFNPPHLGHLILAAEAGEQLALARVLWVLTPTPPHKRGQDIAPLALRLEMTQAMIQDNSLFELSRVDIDRPGPHYAVDTARLLRAQYPEAELVYLLGGDSLRDLHLWVRAAELLNLVNGLGVLRRPGFSIDTTAVEAGLPGVMEKVEWVDAPLLEISSSDIRDRAASGRNIRYFTPPAVEAIIHRSGLYLSDGPHKQAQPHHRDHE